MSRPGLYRQSSTEASWNEIFSAVAPLMIDEATDLVLGKGIEDFIMIHEAENITKVYTKPKDAVTKIEVEDQNCQRSKTRTVKR
jgi:hypothetical protein